MRPLSLQPYRCHQCLARFFQFRNSRARIVMLTVACVGPAALLTLWFAELHNYQKTGTMAPKSVTSPRLKGLFEMRIPEASDQSSAQRK